MSKGNTVGKIVGTPSAPKIPAAEANPPVKAETAAEAGTGAQIMDGVQLGLDVVGLIPGVGEIADLANAGISAARGDWIGASLSLASAIPFAGWGASAAKAGRRGAKMAAEAGAKATKEAADRAAKEAAEKAAKEAAEKAEKEAAEKAGKGKDGGKSKPKKKLKCGEYGKYGDLKKKTGEGKFDRDHIPSKAALKERALELNGGVPLTAKQKAAIDSWGNSIAIPRQAHIDVSPTHGTKNIALAPKDAENLAGAARRDVEEMLKKIDEYDADGGCKKAYQKSAKRVLKMSNRDFDDALQGIMDKAR